MSFEEKIELQLSNFTDVEKELYKKRIGVEHFFVILKEYIDST